MSVDPVTLAINAALIAANAALTASQEFEGPRLDNLDIATADYGAPLNYVYGRRRLSGITCIFAEPLKEVKRQNKTKGGKYNEYKYYGTWAVALCDHEVDDVLRIWADKQLVYDKTGAGPVSPLTSAAAATGTIGAVASAVVGAKSLSNHLRIYTGTASQEPDPRMSATVDAQFGEGSTPAYRGVAYIMFEDMPLEKFGNRFPVIEAEVITAGAAHYPYETIATPISQPNRMWGATFSPDRTRFMWASGSSYAIVDLAARQIMFTGSFPSAISAVQDVFGVTNAGYIWTVNSSAGSAGNLKLFSPDGQQLVQSVALDYSSEFCQVLQVPNGLEYVCVVTYGTIVDGIQYLPPWNPVQIESFNPGWAACQYLNDSDGNIWAVGRNYGTNTLGFFCIAGERFAEGITLTSPDSSTTDPPAAAHNGQGAFVVAHGSKLFLVDDQDFSVGTTVSFTFDVYNRSKQFIACPPGSPSIWLNGKEVSLTTLETLRTIDVSDWKAEDADGMIYDLLNHALLCAPQFDALLTWRYLDRAAGDDVLLADVVGDVAGRCGLEAGEFDVSDLDQTLTGYSWTQGTGKQILAPLLEAYDSFARPHDFSLSFVRRGDASLGTIPVGDMRADGGKRYALTATLDTDLPRRAGITFADPAIDQQPNTATAQRPVAAVDSVREQSLDLTTLVLEADFARQMLERWLRRQWFEAEAVENSVSRKYTTLEPGDVYDLDLDGAALTAQLQSVEFGANGVLALDWKRDRPEIHTLSSLTGAPADGIQPQTLPILSYTKGFVLDIPLVDDADEGLIVYLAAGPFGDGFWPGAVFYESPDAITYSIFDGLPPDLAATWGTCDDALPDALPEVWDRSSSITVTIRHGTLTSATEAEVENGANRAVIGDEIVGFTTATLVSAGVYEVSGFLRGRRGTEWATGDHATGDRFVLLDRRRRYVMGASDIGQLAYYRPVTAGAAETAGFAEALTYSGASARPYAPAHLKVVDSSGDKVATWVRRTRAGGAWRDYDDASLGEGSEAYAATILDAGGAVVRTITGLSSPTVTYTAAQQSADGGAGVSIAVAQVSSIAGAGFASAAALP